MSQDEVQVLNNKVEALSGKMDKVIGYLHNDSGTGELGLVADFKGHKKEFSDFKVQYEKDQAVRKAKIGVWASIGGAVALFGKWVGGLLIEHIKF